MIRTPSALRALLLPLFSALALHAPAALASADSFPNKPVRIIVPVAPGGSADKLTRTLADKLAALWGQSVVVENVAGASGTIGAAKVAKAAPDGYTLLQQGEGLTLNGLLFAQLPYDTQKAFTPIIKAVVNPQVLVVNPGTGLNTLGDYLARAKARPQSISLGLPGNGGIAHVAHEILTQETGAKVNYIPYPGGGPASLDVLGGHTDATLITLAAVTEYVRAGKLRALAVTTPYRSDALPQVPTMAEAGVPGFEAYAWQGFVGPAHLSPALTERLNKSLATALRHPETRAKLEEIGIQPMEMTPQQFAGFVRSEQALWSGVIKAANIKMD